MSSLFYFVFLCILKLNGMAKKKEQVLDKKKMSEKAIDLIMDESISLSEACEKVNLHRRYFYEVIKEDVELHNKYVRACEIRSEFLFDELLNIARRENTQIERKSGSNDVLGKWDESKIFDNVGRSKLEADIIKFKISKMNPKKFGSQKVDDKDNKITISFEEAE